MLKRIITRYQRYLSYITQGSRPKSSEILTCHLRQAGLPHWTAFCVRYSAIENDQFGLSHFNWVVDGANYHVLRTGAFPYVKYHCTKRPHSDLSTEDRLYTWLKLLNLGIPTLAYGIAMLLMVSHKEEVVSPRGTVAIYFWYKENRESQY